MHRLPSHRNVLSLRHDGRVLQHNTRGLMAAVSSLPELTERKRTIDKHTNLATALLGAIQGRHLNEFYNAEEDMLVGKADLSSLQLLLKVCTTPHHPLCCHIPFELNSISGGA